MQLVGTDTGIDVVVNGSTVAKVPADVDRMFGTLTEKDRGCRVRNVKLTGDWPKQLPADLMAPQD